MLRQRIVKYVLTGLRVVVMCVALLLLFVITKDTFENVSFMVDPKYLRFQFWICMIFIADVITEFLLSKKTWGSAVVDLLFLVVCLPYINIINYFDLHVSGEVMFVIRALPMLRATYVIVEVTRKISSNFITSVFKAYITLFIAVVYLASLMFFVAEHQLNKDVETYWSALWWTVMTLTTAGCYIDEVTAVGKILSTVLSAGGLILFPVFTVYVANAVSKNSGNFATKHHKDEYKQDKG